MFKIEFSTSNGAFDFGNDGNEISRILKEVAEHVKDGATSGRVIDINGNAIGTWSCE